MIDYIYIAVIVYLSLGIVWVYGARKVEVNLRFAYVVLWLPALIYALWCLCGTKGGN